MVLDAMEDMFWEQMVRGPTHRLGNTLDLCITSPELVAGVEVISPLGNSDHSGLELNIIGMTADRSSKEEGQQDQHQGVGGGWKHFPEVWRRIGN